MTLAMDTTLVGWSFAIYTLVVIGVGLYATRFARGDSDDFFLAGRSLGPWVAALSASASAESGWVTMGLVGAAFLHGMQTYWIIPGCLIGFMFDWFVMAGPMAERARKMGAVTVPDILALWFRERRPILRVLSVVIILVSMMAYVGGQLAAAGTAFNGTFDLQYKYGVLIGAGIVLIYTVTGGFRAVCWTNYAQAVIMVGTLFAFPLYMLIEYGGYGFISEHLSTAVDESRGVKAGDLMRVLPEASGLGLLGFLLGSRAMGINFGYPGQPHILVRFMALKDRSQARKAGVISAVWTGLIFWGVITTGLLVRAVYQSGELWAKPLFEGSASEAGLVVAGLNMLPGVLAGMVLAAVLSAICSTADSQLIVAASAVAHDIYARFFGRNARPAQMMWINRIVVLALGAGAVRLIIDESVSVYKYVLTYAWAMLGASFGPQIILLLLWRRASYAGCIAGMGVGFATAIAWPQLYDADRWGFEFYNLTAAFIAALMVNVIVSLIVPRTKSLERE